MPIFFGFHETTHHALLLKMVLVCSSSQVKLFILIFVQITQFSFILIHFPYFFILKIQATTAVNFLIFPLNQVELGCLSGGWFLFLINDLNLLLALATFSSRFRYECRFVGF